MLYPPRPTKAIDPDDLPRYEAGNLGWWAQGKLNGTCSVLETHPNGLVTYTRHLEPHKLWVPSASEAVKPLLSIPGEHTMAGELLLSKVKGGHKDVIYLFDLMSYKGKSLEGETYEDRYGQLLDLLKPSDEGDMFYLKVSPKLWVARNLLTRFREVFTAISDPEVEGLVLKNPRSRLLSCEREGSNGRWQVKCRKGTKNYSF
jgi:ATP-dependent DNA ligase